MAARVFPVGLVPASVGRGYNRDMDRSLSTLIALFAAAPAAFSQTLAARPASIASVGGAAAAPALALPLPAASVMPAAAAPSLAASVSASVAAAPRAAAPAGRVQLSGAAVAGERAGEIFDGLRAASEGVQPEPFPRALDARPALARSGPEKAPTSRQARRVVSLMIAEISAGAGGLTGFAVSFGPVVAAAILAALPVAYWALKKRKDLGEDLIQLPLFVIASAAAASAVAAWAGTPSGLDLILTVPVGTAVGGLAGLAFALKSIPRRDRD